MGLNVTVALLVVQLIALGLCVWQDRKPINLAKPRLLPYRLISLILLVTVLATLAHLVALVTGNPIMPRRGRMGMR